jgi:hypothetical protein
MFMRHESLFPITHSTFDRRSEVQELIILVVGQTGHG